MFNTLGNHCNEDLQKGLKCRGFFLDSQSKIMQIWQSCVCRLCVQYFIFLNYGESFYNVNLFQPF